MENSKYDELSDQTIAIFRKDGLNVALDYIDGCIEKSPDFLEAYLIRGDMYMNIDEFDRAIEDFEKAIQINPD
jgi:tetratricopeptide (TPR) repeat protein